MQYACVMEYLELALRWIFGLQIAFWGLNGFFHWVQIPPSPPVIEKFVQACIETRFIMPMVKVIEIAAGLLLLFNFSTALCLAVLTPIMLVVTGLHVLHNPKPAAVLVPLVLPYAALWLLNGVVFLRIFHSTF